MPEALSDKTIEIVKSTVPALEAGGAGELRKAEDLRSFWLRHMKV
jgi:hypothetical protein